MKKVKAGTLLFTLTISFLLAILSSSAIIFFFYKKKEIQIEEAKYELFINAKSGINYYLSDQNELISEFPFSFSLFNKNNDSVTLDKKPWGVYDIITSKAHFRIWNETKVAIVGNSISTASKPSLYLSDLDKPLSVCGDTYLKGPVYLPKAGIKRAYIEGTSFKGVDLVDGTILKSNSNLPAIDDDLIKRNFSEFEQLIKFQPDLFDWNDDNLSDSVKNSFLKKPILMHNSNAVHLSNKFFNGNIIIYSASAIIIDSTCVLNDVVILSPIVRIGNGFKGNCQILSSDSIILGKRTNLSYPSALFLKRRQISTDNIVAEIGEESKFKGIIIAIQDNATLKQNVFIKTQENVEIYGDLYTNGTSDLKGKIYGSVYTKKISLSTASSFYENHLLNVHLNQSKLPENFSGLTMKENTGSKKLIKWLY